MPVDSAARPRMSPAVVVMMLTVHEGTSVLSCVISASLPGFIMMLVAFGVSQWLGGGVPLVQQHREAPAAFNPGLQHGSV